MQGSQMVNRMIAGLMNRGLKQIAKNVFASANPERMAMGMMDAFIGKNQKYAALWKQAKNMAFSGTEQEARQKAKNLYSERGIDVDEIIDSVMNEVRK